MQGTQPDPLSGPHLTVLPKLCKLTSCNINRVLVMTEMSVQSEEQWNVSIICVGIKYYGFHLLNFMDKEKK